ncbi:MAG: rhomboid family intramembrane serine protease [Pseudomonadota bacterium]
MSESGDQGAGRPRRLRATHAGGALAGAPVPRGFFGNIPGPVAILAGLLAVIFVALALSPPLVEYAIGERFGLSPQRLIAGPAASGGVFRLIAPVFTHIFLHATIAHLLFNLLWLLVFGTPIARRFGSAWRFYLFFALSGAAGGLFFSLFHFDDPTLLIGASGGITGLLGGLVRFAFHRPDSRPSKSNGVLGLTDRSVLTWSLVVILMNASVAILGPRVGAGEADIAWQAHVGGYLFGLLAFPLFDPGKR